MDEIVLRSMLKWPDVPAVYGWLSLDRRGNWMIKTVAGRFERIAHAAVREFIGRNYASDPEGRWYFQNGPQRVFVALDCTPWVYRLDDAGQGLLAHTGAVPRALEAVFLDGDRNRHRGAARPRSCGLSRAPCGRPGTRAPPGRGRAGRGGEGDAAGQDGADRIHSLRGHSRPVRIRRASRAAGGRAGVLSWRGCKQV